MRPCRSPSAERRPRKRLVGFLLGVDLADTPPDQRIEIVRADAELLGREQCVAELASVLSLDTSVPLFVAGPDAPGVVAAAAGRPLVLVDATSAGDPQLLREAALIAALERGLVALGGVEQLEPGPARAMGRWLASRERAHDPVRALGHRGVHARRPADDHLRGARAVATPSAARPGAAPRAPTTSTTSPPSSGSRSARSSRPPRSRRWSPPPPGARPRRADLDLGARRASSGALGQLATRLDLRFAWDDLILPPRSSEVLRSISAYIRHRDLVLSDWGYDAHRGEQPGRQDALRRRLGHGQDDGRAGAGRRPRAGDLPARPRDRGVEVHRGDGEEPRPHLRRRRRLERDPLLRRGRRAVRQALRGPGRARPLREPRGRLPAAAHGELRRRRRAGHQLPPEHRRGVPAAARLRGRLPVPGGRRPRADLAAAAAARGAARRRRRPRSSSRTSSSSPAATSATRPWPPHSWRPRTAA